MHRMANSTKTYMVAVTVRCGNGSYSTRVTTQDEDGAFLLARLLKEHDPEVRLTEVTESTTTTTRDIPIKKLSQE